jgi:hypothetical protein
LSSLSRLGLGLYELLPDYRDCCPVCSGRDCAVRHGLYYRGLVDVDGQVYERFPVVRFRCLRRGPKQARDVTFSVLPAAVVPRRRLSLELMQWLVGRVTEGGRAISRVLDEAARLGGDSRPPLLLEEVTIQRLLVLFAALYGRLLSFPVPGVPLGSGLETVREQARAAARVLASHVRCRGSPDGLVMAFHRTYFPFLLADLRLRTGEKSVSISD